MITCMICVLLSTGESLDDHCGVFRGRLGQGPAAVREEVKQSSLYNALKPIGDSHRRRLSRQELHDRLLDLCPSFNMRD